MALHHCGTDNAEDAKFCKGCGEPLAAAALKKVCPECSTEMESDARFCSNCGATASIASAGVSKVAAPARATWKYLIVAGAIAVALGAVWAGWSLGGKPASEPVEAQTREPTATAKRSVVKTEDANKAEKANAQDRTVTAEPKARIQEVHGKKTLGARSPREACADSSNFLSRSICETKKCSEAAYAKHPICVELFETKDRNERLRREGYGQ